MSDARAYSLRDAAIGELIATAFLLIAVVGSGIAAERFTNGNLGLALLANAFATAGALFALIVAFAPVSGAHMNPAVTLSAAILGKIGWHVVPYYIAAQITGAIFGTCLAHFMFQLDIITFGTHARTGPSQWLAEVIATVGLLGVVWSSTRYDVPTTAAAVAAYIGGAYWFTASTSFANPAVTMARALTDTFSGIRPVDSIGFIAAQLTAVALSIPFIRRLTTANRKNALLSASATPWHGPSSS